MPGFRGNQTLVIWLERSKLLGSSSSVFFTAALVSRVATDTFVGLGAWAD
jgi:hypothetical protein